jgi:hypothetical protein
MTLRALIESLPKLDRSSSVYVEQEQHLKADSEVQLVTIPKEAESPPAIAGMRCFMDVWQIREVLSGKAQLNGLDTATADQQVEMLLSFASRGA